MKDKFTICVLLFGDYPDLARRCLQSLLVAAGPQNLNLRIGMNAVSDRTKNVVQELIHVHGLPVHPYCEFYEYTENRHKYPVMREMIHGISPITTPYTMWFDDDSFLELQPNSHADGWLAQVERAMQNADMIGSIYGIPWRGRQREFIKAQAWYNGKDPIERTKARFATGGWWTIRTPLLYQFNYPWPFLDHRGGDVMLGELCFQQGLRLQHFNTGVKINANAAGQESKATRRGFDQEPVGVDFDPGIGAVLHRVTPPPLLPPTQLDNSKPKRRIVDL